MAEHDYKIRIGRVKELLEKAYRVRLVIAPKGVINNSPIAKEQMWKRILDDLTAQYGKPFSIMSPPQVQFRNLTATVVLINAKPPSTRPSHESKLEDNDDEEE